jgi:hypothetical protein
MSIQTQTIRSGAIYLTIDHGYLILMLYKDIIVDKANKIYLKEMNS